MSKPKDPDNHSVDDETWQEIVSRLEATPDEGTEAKTAEKNDGDASLSPHPTEVPQEHADRSDSIGFVTSGQEVRSVVEPGADGDTLGGPRDYTVREPEEEGVYNPDVDVNLSGANPVLVLGWVGLVGSVIAAVVILFLRPSSSWWFIGAVLVFLACAGLLLWRMPTQRGSDDDGAQV